jgi:hypothetical protein
VRGHPERFGPPSRRLKRAIDLLSAEEIVRANSLIDLCEQTRDRRRA